MVSTQDMVCLNRGWEPDYGTTRMGNVKSTAGENGCWKVFTSPSPLTLHSRTAWISPTYLTTKTVIPQRWLTCSVLCTDHVMNTANTTEVSNVFQLRINESVSWYTGQGITHHSRDSLFNQFKGIWAFCSKAQHKDSCFFLTKTYMWLIISWISLSECFFFSVSGCLLQI